MDDLVSFEESNLADVINNGDIMYNSMGQKIDKEIWLTMMHFATNERQPERQFCLVTNSLAKKINRRKFMTDEEYRLTEEISESEARTQQLKLDLEKISSEEKETNKEDEENTVQNTGGEVSQEIISEGLKMKIVYSKGARKVREILSNQN